MYRYRFRCGSLPRVGRARGIGLGFLTWLGGVGWWGDVFGLVGWVGRMNDDRTGWVKEELMIDERTSKKYNGLIVFTF